MEMEIGVGLIRLADPSRGGDLLPRITGVRQAVAGDIGIVLPKVRIRDNMRLGENDYRIKIANNPVAEGDVYPDSLLAMDSGSDHWRSYRRGDARSGVCSSRPSGLKRHARSGRDVGLHARGAGRRAGHASAGSRPPSTQTSC